MCVCVAESITPAHSQTQFVTMATAAKTVMIDIIKLVPKRLYVECARGIPIEDVPAAMEALEKALLKAAAKIWPVYKKPKSTKKSESTRAWIASLTKKDRVKRMENILTGKAEAKERRQQMQEEAAGLQPRKKKNRWAKDKLAVPAPPPPAPDAKMALGGTGPHEQKAKEPEVDGEDTWDEMPSAVGMPTAICPTNGQMADHRRVQVHEVGDKPKMWREGGQLRWDNMCAAV